MTGPSRARATAVMSMWISNTATTVMLLPVALAMLATRRTDPNQEGTTLDQPFAVALLLGIAYAANIGGLGTPVGSPPNIIFQSVYHEKTGLEVSFLQWMLYGVPVIGVLLPLTWWVLVRSLDETTVTPHELSRFGPLSWAQKWVLSLPSDGGAVDHARRFRCSARLNQQFGPIPRSIPHGNCRGSSGLIFNCGLAKKLTCFLADRVFGAVVHHQAYLHRRQRFRSGNSELVTPSEVIIHAGMAICRSCRAHRHKLFCMFIHSRDLQGNSICKIMRGFNCESIDLSH